MTLSGSDQAFYFIVLVLCLGACLILAIHEIEARRERRRQREALTRAAMRTVAPVGPHRS